MLLPGAPKQYDQANESQTRREIEKDAKTNAKVGQIYDKIYMRDVYTDAIMEVTVSGAVLVVTTA